MKKIISLAVAMFMFITGTTVFAQMGSDTVTKEVGEAPIKITSTDSLEKALINVKSRIEIPANLDIFESSSFVNDEKTYYNFSWRDADYNASLNISCDYQGRITDYYRYSNDYDNYHTGKKLPDISKDQAIEMALNFIKKAAPEAFLNDNDILVLSEQTGGTNAYGNGATYTFVYNREKDGTIVKNNEVSINLRAMDQSIIITNFNVGFDYEAIFEDKGTEISDSKSSFKSAFPVELIYEKQYNYMPIREGSLPDDKKIDLIYRIKDNDIGFISAYSGEVITPDNVSGIYYSRKEAAKDSSEGGGDGETALTEAEIAELKNISELKSAEEIEMILRNISELKLDKSMKINEVRISKIHGEYVINLSLYNNDEKNYHSLNVSADAATGKLLSLYNYNDNYTKEELTDKQKKNAEAAIIKFLENYAGEELQECVKLESDFYTNNFSMQYRRMVNGVPYINNGIYVTYDGLYDTLLNYRLDFDKMGEFKNPKGAISIDEAYDKILNEAPLRAMYVLSEGKYKLCYSLDYFNYIKIDALSGEPIIDKYITMPKNSGNYSDISGHWSETAVKKLAEVGIALSGEQFLPDSEISQEELLRFFAGGLNYNGYLYYDTEMLYESLYNDNYLKKEERNETISISREDAFVYMIRMAGLEKVAKLSQIFKVDFADKDELSEGLIGYAAILSGLKVICGDGGNLRAQSKITKAEAATMIYNYLVN